MNPEIEAVLRGESEWCVINGDGDSIARELANASVDHVICDPGYDEQTHAQARSLKNGGSDIPINFAPQSDLAFVDELLRVSRRWVLAFCALEQLGDYKRASNGRYVRSAIWDRPDGTPQISGDRPAQGAEGIAIMHRLDSKKRWNGGGERGRWICGVEREERLHPTPKPRKLMRRLVELFTDPGDIVLDVRAGSCTTGVACLQLGRRFIGVEMDPMHYASGLERLLAAGVGLSVKDARAGQMSIFGKFHKPVTAEGCVPKEVA